MSHIPITRVALFLASLGAIGCSDSVTPTASSPRKLPVDGPSFTVGSGGTVTFLARGTLGAFHLQSKTKDYDIELKSNDNTDVIVRGSLLAAGGYSGWHSHSGPVILAIKTGTLTVYRASDPSCTPQVYPAGTAFFEPQTTPHNVRNEGAVMAEIGVVFFLPVGAAPRIEEDFPPNCPP
jgi:quercetin dioxygenase-like cupin family protein